MMISRRRWSRILLLGCGVGAVASAQPAPDRCTPLAVEESLSKGSMPDVTGCQLASVQVEFQRSRSPVNAPPVPNTAAAGTIVNQQPTANSVIARGDGVTLFVSTGQAPPPKTPSTAVKVAPPRANLAVTSRLQGTARPHPGEGVAFTVDVTNAGPDAAVETVVSGVPENLRNVTASGACSSLPCTFASLPAGSALHLTVMGMVAAVGSFGETFSVQSATRDPDPSDNSSTVSGEVEAVVQGGVTGGDAPVQKPGSAHLTLSGDSDFGHSQQPGDPVSFTVTLTNDGKAPARDVHLIQSPTNLEGTKLSGPCADVPCTLQPNGSRTFSGKGSVTGSGTYGLIVVATGVGLGKSAQVAFHGTAQGSTGVPWGLVAGVVLGLGLLAAAAALATPSLRRRWWWAHVAARCTVDLNDNEAHCGRLTFRGPAIGLLCEVPPAAEPRISAMKTIWQEVKRG